MRDTLLWRHKGRRIPIDELDNNSLIAIKNWMIKMSYILNPNYEMYDITIKQWIDSIEYEQDRREFYNNQNIYNDELGEMYSELSREIERELETIKRTFSTNGIIKQEE